MSKTIRYALVAVVALFLIGGSLFAGGMVRPLRHGYEASPVPYAGWKRSYGQKDVYGEETGYRGLESAPSSLLMVSWYWRLRDPNQPLLQPDEVLAQLSRPIHEQTLEEIATAARLFSFKAKIQRVPLGVLSLASYGRKPTPLIVEQYLSPDYPEQGTIFRVVLGLSPGGQNVYVHDYVYGVHRALPRAEFLALWKKPHRVLVIEPEDRGVADAATPPFGGYNTKPLNETAARLLTLAYVAEESRAKGMTAKTILFLEQLTRDASFKSTFSRVDKVYYTTVLMSLYNQEQSFTNTTALENLVLTLNTNLTGPAQGNVENYETWLLLAKAFDQLNNDQKTKIYAERALAANPESKEAKELLEEAEEHLRAGG